jgi:hypothetical protein
MAMQTQQSGLIDVDVHGLSANLLFAEHGLQPYWGLVDAFEPDYEGDTITVGGEDYTIDKSTYWSGGIADPNGNIDDGLNEYKLALWTDDEAEDKGADFTFRAGYPHATHCDTGDEIGGMPTECPESIRVQVESTNLSRLDVLVLLQALASHIDLNPSYFQDAHEWSSIYGIEAYVRVHRDVAVDRLVSTGGVLEELEQFSHGQGRGEYKWDHEDIEGHYEGVALGPTNWSKLLPEQTLAKRLKCYQPKYVRGEHRSDDPLYHHKLECQYWADYSDESLDWDNYDAIFGELRQTVLNALNWADVPLEPTADAYVEDAYFDVERCADDVEIVANPMPELEETQQATARESLMDPETSPAEWDIVEAMVGAGSRHYQAVAEAAGRSSSSVYRAVEQFDTVLEIDGGELRFVDDVVRQEIETIVDRFQQATENTLDAVRRAADKANPLSRGDDENDEPSPVERWMNRHGIVPTETYDGLEFSLDRPVSRRKLEEILRAGIDAAERSGLLTERFESALIDWVDRDGQHHRNWQVVVDGHVLTAGGGSARC